MTKSQLVGNPRDLWLLTALTARKAVMGRRKRRKTVQEERERADAMKMVRTQGPVREDITALRKPKTRNGQEMIIQMMMMRMIRGHPIRSHIRAMIIANDPLAAKRLKAIKMKVIFLCTIV